MSFSLEQVQTFVAVVRSGSFSAAARQHKRSQSAISSAIANLEIDLGVPLFDRTSREPVLTEAGRHLLHRAEVLLEQQLALQEQAHSLGAGTSPRLTVAIEVPHVSVIPVMREFALQFPYVDLTLRNPAFGDVSELVRQQEAVLGVAFAQGDYASDLAFARMGTLVMVHVACPDHPLAGLPSVAFADLRSHRHLAFAAHASKLPTSEYLQASQTWKAENYAALTEMARAGLGWATLPRQLIRDELDRGELVELQLESYPHTDWLVGVDLLWSRTQQLGPAERWLREALQRHAVFDAVKARPSVADPGQSRA